MDEKQIIRLCQNNRHEYYEALVIKYEKPLYRYCFHLCRNPQDAKDLFQETWLKAMGRIKLYKEAYSFKNWLFSIATNIFRDKYRRKIRRAKLVKEFSNLEKKEWELGNVPSNDIPADAGMETKEVREQIKNEVNRLKWPYKSVIVLHYFEERTLKDIGLILGIPEGTVKSRLSKARSILGERMEM